MRATILWGYTMGLYNKLYPDMFLCDEVSYLRKKHVSWANSDQIGIIFAEMILGWYLYITCIIQYVIHICIHLYTIIHIIYMYITY